MSEFAITSKEIVSKTLQLPEFSGDLNRWNRDVRILNLALEAPDGCEFEAQLPEIVGYVTEEERAVINCWPVIGPEPLRVRYGGATDYDYGKVGELADIEQQLPATLKIIKDDIKLVSGGRRELYEFEVENRLTEAGNTPGNILGEYGEAIYLHTDLGIQNSSRAETSLYLISNTQPTWFYEGPASYYKVADSLKLESRDLDRSRPLVAAPHFAVVRMSPATVHGSPIFEETATRAMMRAMS